MSYQLISSIKQLLLTLLLVFVSVSPAHSEAELTPQQKQLIADEVSRQVQKLITEQGVLDQAIERGIIDYVSKQKARQQRQSSRGGRAANVRRISSTQDHIRGNPDATISLVEYSDFECPFCKRFHPSAKQLLEKNPETVNWVYRHFPLNFHSPGAQKQAEASECAAKLGGNEAFWTYTDLIYERTTSNGKGFPIKNLVPLAVEVGLHGEEFKACLDSGEMAKRVQADYENGVKSGITGTPGNIFVNNKTGQVHAASGALPYENLQAIVDALMTPAENRKQ